MVTKATKRSAPSKRAARSKRESSASADRLSKTRDAVSEVADAVRIAAQAGLVAAREASGKMASSLPAKRALKTAVGRALVTGGRALIDPRGAVGEMAVRLGEGLLEDAGQLHWFVVRLDDSGHAATYGFVRRADAQAFYDTTRKTFPRQYLCEAVVGPAR